MKNSKLLLLASLIAIGGLTSMYFFNRTKKIPIRHLPYYGNKKPAAGDTIYHTIPDFKFLNQEGKEITKRDIAGKIYVTDYFFTTCQSICPVMKKQMSRVYEHFKKDPQVILVSHTVDPEHDTVQTLKEFAASMSADPNKWFFLTGDKKELYELARRGYILDASEGDGSAEDFIHTQNFALVDKEFHIRGYYDGTDSAQINKLIKEIELLKSEYSEEK